MFWSVEEFCDGFLKLVDHLELDKVLYVLFSEHLSQQVMYVHESEGVPNA